MESTALAKSQTVVDEIISSIPQDVIKQLPFGVEDQTDLTNIIIGLKKPIIDSTLGGGIDYYLNNVQDKLLVDNGSHNIRNGYSNKTVKTDDGDIDIALPRDRLAKFELVLVQKYKLRLEGIDDIV